MEKYTWLNSHSRLFLERGYLKEGVTPEQRIREIAETAEKYLGIIGFADKFEHYMALGFYSLSTPCWTNYGNERGLPVSCFGSYVNDGMTDILTKVGEIGIMSKMGGGTSGYFGDLRPRGAKISVGGESSGPVHFMELFDKVADVVSQGSARRGSFAAYLPVEHPDIEEFLQIRSEGHPIQNMSIGVTITDKWMEEMTAGDKDKRKLWGKIIQKRFETGYPYITFIDNCNNAAPQVYKDKKLQIKAQNLCVTGNQRVVSNLGLLTAKELYELNQPLILFDNKNPVSASEIKLIERDTDVYKITLENGLSHTITDYHKVATSDKLDANRQPIINDVACKDLKIGDRVAIQTEKGLFGNIHMPDEAFLLGLYQADGTQHKDTIHICVWEKDFDLLEEIQSKFDSLYKKYDGDKYINFSRSKTKTHTPKFYDSNVGFSNVKKKTLQSPFLKRCLSFEKGKVPQWIWESDEKTQWQYIRGLYYADGTVNITNGKGNPFYLSITNINKNFLEELQILLLNLGITCALSIQRKAGTSLLPDGKGGKKLYNNKESYRLVCGNKNDGLIFEKNTGFITRKGKILNPEGYRDNTKKFSRVKSVEYVGKEDVYCCTVDSQNHHWICNGMVTHNCNEISLSSDVNNSFVCVLSSLNLLHWDEIVKTDAIETLIYFLDTVNEEFVLKTENMKYMEAPHNFAKTQRALGLGVLGWHSLLQSKSIPFESMEAKLMNSSIWKTIREKADSATEELAKLFGEPELLKGYGRRNVTTLAVAPTTSSSFILGQVSPSIEPLNSNYFVKKLAKGSFTYKNPYFKKLLKEKNKNDDETWKSILLHGGSVQHLDFLSDHEKAVYKTFGEISQKEVVIQAAQRQPRIDQGQSLNVMVPLDIKPKEVSELYIEGWRMKVKGFYYQRGASPTQALSRSIMTCTSCEA